MNEKTRCHFQIKIKNPWSWQWDPLKVFCSNTKVFCSNLVCLFFDTHKRFHECGDYEPRNIFLRWRSGLWSSVSLEPHGISSQAHKCSTLRRIEEDTSMGESWNKLTSFLREDMARSLEILFQNWRDYRGCLVYGLPLSIADEEPEGQVWLMTSGPNSQWGTFCLRTGAPWPEFGEQEAPRE